MIFEQAQQRARLDKFPQLDAAGHPGPHETPNKPSAP